MTNRPQWDSILENTSVLLSAFLNYFMRWTVEWVGSQQTNSNQKEWIYEYSLNKAAKVEPTCFIFTWCGSFLMWSCYPFKSDLVALMLVLLLQFPPAKCKVQFLTWLWMSSAVMVLKINNVTLTVALFSPAFCTTCTSHTTSE